VPADGKADAWEVFEGPLIARLDLREDYGEDRWQGIGMLQGRVVVVVFTEREPDTIRIISLRKADRDVRNAYAKALQDGLGTY
jgi:uncharacterized DUF497 family protein